METIILKRISLNRNGTYGVLLHEFQPGAFQPFAVTFELQWNDNTRNISCIPKGQYLCERYSSTKYADTFQVKNVPGRSYILFHVGNTQSDSEGCILVGEQFEKVLGKEGVASSKDGFGEFLENLKGESEFTLKIIEV